MSFIFCINKAKYFYCCVSFFLSEDKHTRIQEPQPHLISQLKLNLGFDMEFIDICGVMFGMLTLNVIRFEPWYWMFFHYKSHSAYF